MYPHSAGLSFKRRLAVTAPVCPRMIVILAFLYLCDCEFNLIIVGESSLVLLLLTAFSHWRNTLGEICYWNLLNCYASKFIVTEHALIYLYQSYITSILSCHEIETLLGSL
ncbi:hypothetical protein GGR57DRAFT_462073, partial [Xylariaceae sp. FL1272]